MCHSCKTCNQEPRNCKTELRRRLVRALEIVDSVKGDSFTLEEAEQAVELHGLLDDVQRDHIPEIKAWCTVKVYGGPKPFAQPCVWDAFASKAVAAKQAVATEAHYRAEHEKHPWWGPWKTCGDRFVVKLTTCRVGALVHSMKKVEESDAKLGR